MPVSGEHSPFRNTFRLVVVVERFFWIRRALVDPGLVAAIEDDASAARKYEFGDAARCGDVDGVFRTAYIDLEMNLSRRTREDGDGVNDAGRATLQREREWSFCGMRITNSRL